MTTIAREPLMEDNDDDVGPGVRDGGVRGARTAALPTGVPKDATKTAEVLGKLHASNLKEINLGKLAEKQGQSQAVKDFGKTLAKDTPPPTKRSRPWPRKRVSHGGATPMASTDMGQIPPGRGFDSKFAQMMVDDHKKDIAEATAARNASHDEKLIALLDRLFPVLQEHEARPMVSCDGTTK